MNHAGIPTEDCMQVSFQCPIGIVLTLFEVQTPDRSNTIIYNPLVLSVELVAVHVKLISTLFVVTVATLLTQCNKIFVHVTVSCHFQPINGPFCRPAHQLTLIHRRILLRRKICVALVRVTLPILWLSSFSR